MTETLSFWLAGWVICSIVIVFFYNQKAWSSSGLVICFILQYTLQYWLGAVLNIFPWWFSPHSDLVALGMEQCVYALIGFGIGCIIIAPICMPMFKYDKTQEQLYKPNPRLPTINLIVGVLIYWLSPDILRNTPSIRNLVYLSWYFIITNACLIAWNAYFAGKLRIFLLMLLLALWLPIFTTFSQGFLGFGMEGALVIFIFVSLFYRPRIVTIIGLLLGVYLGLSVFVTYFRDRDLIRGAAHTGQPISARVDRLTIFFNTFEFIDFHNEAHLAMLDSRLNQCYLVGAAVYNLQKGYVRFAEGETIYNSFLAIIPRIIWPEKTMHLGGSEVVSKYTATEFEKGTSVGIGPPMEFYINFGTPFVVIGFIILGTLVAFFDLFSKKYLEASDWPRFILYFMLGMNFLSPLASVQELVMVTGGTLFFYVVIMKQLIPMIAKAKLKVDSTSGSRRTGT